MQQLFDESKREIANNLRRNLYNAINAEYISSTEIQDICAELKKYLPDDFMANFYSVASGTNIGRIARFIRNLSVEENYEYIGDAITFLIRSLQPEFLLELNDLVERAYKYRDLTLYEKYATDISREAEKVQSGVYETKLPREVFVAYSSKDMGRVMDLVEHLESQGLKCFVAARNLRHGRGAVENYDRAIKEAIDHCKTFVFISSTNSRSLSCDALEIELSYVRQIDIYGAPSELRNNYAAIPHRYKKPRVEYRIEESRRYNAADEITNEFFDGYERVYSPDEVASRIVRQLIGSQGRSQNENKQATAPASKKFCVECGYESDAGKKFCAQCGANEFAPSVAELLKIRERRQNGTVGRTEKAQYQKVSTDANKDLTGGEARTQAGGADSYKSYQEIALKAYNEYLKNSPDTKNKGAEEAKAKSQNKDTVEDKERKQEKNAVTDGLKKIAVDVVHNAANGINEFLNSTEKKIAESGKKAPQNSRSENAKKGSTTNYSASNPYSKHYMKTEEDATLTRQAKENKKTRVGWLIATVILSFMTVIYIFLFIITAAICFASLTCMSVVMMLSPRKSPNILGKEKGLPKWAFVLICSLVSFVMIMI